MEDVAIDKVRSAIDPGRYRATADPSERADFEVAVISVPTPTGGGVHDISYTESAVTLAPCISVGSTVMLESTTYPGTTEELAPPILEVGSTLRLHGASPPDRHGPGRTSERRSASGPDSPPPSVHRRRPASTLKVGHGQCVSSKGPGRRSRRPAKQQTWPFLHSPHLGGLPV